MDVAAKISFFFIDLIFPLLTGYLFRNKLSKFPSLSNKLIDFGIYVIEPVLACLSFWAIPLNSGLILLPLLGFVMNLVPAGPAFFLARKKFNDPLKEGSYVLSTILSNRGVIGMLTVFAIYGEPGYAMVTLVMLLSSPFVYLVGFPLAERYHQQGNHVTGAKMSVLSLFLNWKQLPTLGLIVGIFLNYYGIARPQLAESIFPPLVHLSAWLFLIPVGMAINLHELRSYWLQTVDLSLIKFLWTPIIMWTIVRMLRMDPVSSTVTLILSIAPTAINAVITVKLFRLNINLAMAAFVMTTFIYLFIILPILLFWLS